MALFLFQEGLTEQGSDKLKIRYTAISSQVYTKQHIIVVIGELAVLSGQVRDKFENFRTISN